MPWRNGDIKKNGYKIDKNNMLMYVVPAFDVDEKDESIVFIPPPADGSIHLPKWDGVKWIEGKTADEFEIDRITSSLLPSIEDAQEALFEIRLINKLNEWGML